MSEGLRPINTNPSQPASQEARVTPLVNYLNKRISEIDQRIKTGKLTFGQSALDKIRINDLTKAKTGLEGKNQSYGQFTYVMSLEISEASTAVKNAKGEIEKAAAESKLKSLRDLVSTNTPDHVKTALNISKF